VTDQGICKGMTKEICECWHPRWAHMVEHNAGSEETGCWETIGECQWDIDGPKCKCSEYSERRASV